MDRVGVDIAMGQHRAFGPAGSAAGVEQSDQIFFVRLGKGSNCLPDGERPIGQIPRAPPCPRINDLLDEGNGISNLRR